MTETALHKEIFDYFYKLGAGRKHSKVHKKYGVSRTSIRKWSKMFNWPERIKKLDSEITESKPVKRIGRNTKLTPEVQKKIVNLITAGNYVETACGAVGVSHASFYNWLERGRQGEQPFLDFLDAVKKAETVSEALYLEYIRKAAPETWQAAAWYLERRNYQKWGKKTQVDVNVKDLDIQIEEAMKQLAGLKNRNT